MTLTANAIEVPNLFDLTGRDITVSLALTGIDGKPQLAYHDSQHQLSFSGAAITMEDTELGSLASVPLNTTVDLGRTTFTLLVPTINLIGGNHLIETVGIIALHRTSIAGVGHGQLTTYRTVRLHGTASQVEF